MYIYIYICIYVYTCCFPDRTRKELEEIEKWAVEQMASAAATDTYRYCTVMHIVVHYMCYNICIYTYIHICIYTYM